MASYGYAKDKVKIAPYEYNLTLNMRTIDGYTPRNKKCFCFPYNIVRVSTNNGNSVIYKPEYFSDLTWNDNDVTILYDFIFSLQPKLCSYVKGYRGLERYQREMIIYSAFPPIPYKTDTYATWQALNQNSLTQSYIEKGSELAIGLGSLALGVGGMASGAEALSNPPMGLGANQFESYIVNANREYESGKQKTISGGLSALGVGNSIASQMAKVEDMKNQPNHVVGLPQGNELLFSGAVGIYVSQETCRAEYIHMIDDYFTRYGYLINETQNTTITNRVNFDYIQTVECNIQGDIPQEDIDELEAIFNSGVTIWHNINTYGDYNVDNRPRGQQ